jgi:hypothetical protein
MGIRLTALKGPGILARWLPSSIRGAGTVSLSFRDVLFLPYKFRTSDSNKQFLLTLSVYSKFFVYFKVCK